MFKFTKHFSTLSTAQSEAIPGSNQVANSAGGFTWAVTDWVRLDRFLILGSEGGTYYIKEAKLTVENAGAVQRCIAEDGVRVVNTIVAVATEGRAPKTDPAIFALAMCAKLGDEATRKAAYAALPMVCRTGTHLMHFAEYAQGFVRVLVRSGHRAGPSRRGATCSARALAISAGCDRAMRSSGMAGKPARSSRSTASSSASESPGGTSSRPG